MIIISSINHTHSCDIFEYGKVKIFTNIMCFYESMCNYFKLKSADNIIKALDYAFNFLGNSKS